MRRCSTAQVMRIRCQTRCCAHWQRRTEKKRAWGLYVYEYKKLFLQTEIHLWDVSAMDAADQLNMTQDEDSPAEVAFSNCCSPAGTISDENSLKLDDSTKLIGVQGMAVHVSTITLNIIALDRHRSIVYHMETKMSKDMCAVVIIVTWTVSALLASPLAIFREYGTFDLPPDISIQVCTEKWPENSMNGSVYSILMLLVQYGLPLAINSFAYISIWNKLRSHRTYGGQNDRHQQRTKTTKMLLTVVVVFAISWLPLHAFQLAVDIDSTLLYMKDFKLLFTLFHIVAMCSTFVNPILYGWMNNNYRSAFLSVCKCKWPFRWMSRSSGSRDTHKEEERVCTECKSTHV
ncbi:neuropeptide Y receptor type 2-like [Solea senegalensis]|uniref:Neuropeptide Y receptor type 2-like n=1 Tax=Solea senegalensis TaxID=28829 RepID=A0AAV6QEC8_SOLSE|nr:neuropeptide Y receptor type 2-like [Solea senegalensis]